MSDILTFEELKGDIKNKIIAWIGDGNNVSNSFIEAAAKFEFKLKIACPKKYQPDSNIIRLAKKNNCELLITDDPYKAAEDGIRDQPRSRGLGDVYKRQILFI